MLRRSPELFHRRAGKITDRRGIESAVVGLMDVDETDYEQAVALYQEDLHRFAISLTYNPDDARDLTQESYCRFLTKSGQLRDYMKVKSWLFTTLYRVFPGWKRREKRFPHFDLATVEHENPMLTPEIVNKIDGDVVMEALLEIDEPHRTPLVLFYRQSLSCREIAEMLEVPVGTVMSRLSRPKAALRAIVTARTAGGSQSNGTPFPANRTKLFKIA